MDIEREENYSYENEEQSHKINVIVAGNQTLYTTNFINSFFGFQGVSFKMNQLMNLGNFYYTVGSSSSRTETNIFELNCSLNFLEEKMSNLFQNFGTYFNGVANMFVFILDDTTLTHFENLDQIELLIAKYQKSSEIFSKFILICNFSLLQNQSFQTQFEIFEKFTKSKQISKYFN